jgi:hypothetical protein
MKEPFIEGLDLSRVKLDPLAPTHQDFDFDELYRRLDESDPGRVEDTAAMLAEPLRAVFDWVLDTDLQRRGAAGLVGKRLIALAWVITPAMFEGSPSMRKLAARLSIKPALMHRLTAMASKRFGVVNRGQSHGWNRGAAEAPSKAQERPEAGEQGEDRRGGI